MADDKYISLKSENTKRVCRCLNISDNSEMYYFLAHLFKNEVSQEHLDFILGMDVPPGGDKGVIGGLTMMKEYVDQSRLDPLTDLSADFAQLFLGTGNISIASGIHPYESVYTSDNRLIMQEARDHVVQIYTNYRLEVGEGPAIPEDHIGIELEFMAHLSSLISCSQNNRLGSGQPSPLLDKKDFLEQHILNWIPQFCTDIVMQAETTFYKGLARLTDCFLQEEHRMTSVTINKQSIAKTI